MFEKKYSLPNTEYIKRSQKSVLREEVDFPIGSSARDLFRKFLPKGEEVSLTEAFAVSRDDELGYTRFVRGEGDKVEFEFLISDEAKEILGDLGKIEAKKEIKKEINKISEDPYGEKSIDPLVNEPKTHQYRSVNAFSLDLENKLGKPVAIKGSGELDLENKDREDLLAQFRFMKQREQEWQTIGEDIKKIVHICKVYAAIKYKVPGNKEYEEWLIMERIPDAKQVENYKLRVGSNSYGGFKIDEHPLLAEIIESVGNFQDFKIRAVSKRHPKERAYFYDWSTLEKALQSAGLNVSDAAGRNILYTEDDPAKRHYTLIDQRDRSKEIFD